MRQEGNDPLILDAGDLFFTTPDLHDSNRVSEKYRASVILMGYEQIGCDAINVGRYELSAGLPFLLESQSSSTIPFLSANIKDKQTDTLLFKSHIIIERGELTVGVIGLTILNLTKEINVKVDDHISLGNAVIEKIRDKVNIIVLLVNATKEFQKTLATDFPLVDVIYTSGHRLLTRPMMKQPEKSPYIYSTGREARYLNMTEIHINTLQDSIVNVSYLEESKKYNQRKLDRFQDVDPRKPLEKIYEGQKSILNFITKSKEQIKRSNAQLKNANNTLSVKLIPLDSGIEDDPEMFLYVNEALDICNQLKN